VLRTADSRGRLSHMNQTENNNGLIARDEAVPFSENFPGPAYTLNELPQPQVLFTFGFSNLKPAPSRVST
jgi:hypothetical protein